MIKLLRVDDRLLHGQVALTWTRALEADCILIANDAIMKDDFRKMTVSMAKPSGVKLVIKNVEDSIKALNSGVTDKYKLFIVVDSVEDAVKMSNEVERIKSINLGGVKFKENKKKISKAVSLDEKEIADLVEVSKKGIEVDVRQVPVDKKVNFLNLI